MKLDADIRGVAVRMQQRRNEAKKRVANQEIVGMRFMADDAVQAAAEKNFLRVGTLKTGDLTDLSDAANYCLELLGRKPKPEKSQV